MTSPPIPKADQVLARVMLGMSLPQHDADKEQPQSCEGHIGCHEKAGYWPAMQKWLCLAHFEEQTNGLTALEQIVRKRAILEIPVAATTTTTSRR